MLCVHKLREGFKRERTACSNRLRGLLAEFGLVFPQSPEALRQVLDDVLKDASNELGLLARISLQRAAQHWRELDDTWPGATSASRTTTETTQMCVVLHSLLALDR
jgi:transposase